MTTAVSPVNGTTRPAPATAPEPDAVTYAKADAIRREAEAAAEAARIRAEGEAEAARIRAAEDAEKQRIANERQRMRLEREQADHQAKMAEARAKQAAAEQAERKTREAAAAEEKAEAAQAEAEVKAARRWRRTAMGFYALCAAVALPLQMSFFYSEERPYLILAPILIEVVALVALIGAAAAVTARRPHWHYRLIAWAGAAVAASINLSHGLAAFDTATALGTALASIAGPGIWDLHEHGRIRTRDGRPSLRERRAQRRAAKQAAKQAAAEEARAAEEEAARAEAEAERAAKLAEQRAEEYPDEWDRAVKLAAAAGETVVTEEVWARAWDELHALPPGQTVDSIRLRNAAARRVAAAQSETPGQTPQKATKSQRNPQMPTKTRRGPTAGPPVRGVRRKGDTPRYSPEARYAASITARRAAS